MKRSELRNLKVVETLRKYVREGKILDVGAGRGALSHALLEMGYEVKAADIDPSKCKYPDVEMIQCNILKGLPFNDNSFDAITITEVIEHMEDPYLTVRELNRVLKPGGILFITVPNYGNIETRMNYLFRGTLPKAFPFKVEKPGSRKTHGHINTMTIVQLKYLLMTNGFEMIHLSALFPKKKMVFLLPISLLVFLYSHLFWPSQRRKLYHIPDQMKVLFGGSYLLIIGRKKK